MGPFLDRFVGLVVPVQETFFCLGLSSRPSTRYFFLTVHYFNSFVTVAKQAGRQPCCVACLLVCVSGLDQLNQLFHEPLNGLLNLLIYELLIGINLLLN
jgi:hypothetical protein